MGTSPQKHVLTGALDADWKMCAEFFEDSQSSRDIDVSNTTIEDWKQFFKLIANHPGWPVHIGKKRAALPEVVPELFERSTQDQLCFSFPISADISIMCWLSATHYIEMDFSGHISTPQRFKCLTEYIKTLGDFLQKLVRIVSSISHSAEVQYEPREKIFVFQEGNIP